MTRSKNRILETATASSIVWTNDKHAIIRKAVAQILQLAVAASDAEHGRALLDHFVGPLNMLIGGVQLDGETAPFTESMIRNAFHHHNSTSSLADCNHVTGASVEGVIHIRSGVQGSTHGAPIVSKSKLRTLKLDNICEDIINKLRAFLITERKRAAYAKDADNNKRRKINEDEEEDWGWSGGGGEIEEDANEEENIKSLRSQVIEDKARVDELYSRMEELHKELQEANKKFEMSSAALNEAVSSSSSAGVSDDVDLDMNRKKFAIYGDTVGSTSSAENRISVHYYLGGVAGVAEFSGPASNRVITEADLKRGFLPVPVDANKTKKNNAGTPTTVNTP